MWPEIQPLILSFERVSGYISVTLFIQLWRLIILIYCILVKFISFFLNICSVPKWLLLNIQLINFIIYSHSVISLKTVCSIKMLINFFSYFNAIKEDWTALNRSTTSKVSFKMQMWDLIITGLNGSLYFKSEWTNSIDIAPIRWCNSELIKPPKWIPNDLLKIVSRLFF